MTKATARRQQVTELSDPLINDTLCHIQQHFVRQWNHTELTTDSQPSHDLPNGAKYTASGIASRSRFNGASFVLSDGTWICLHATRGWMHWHEGWSFCRNELNPSQVKKVVVHGSMDSFSRWLSSLQPPA